MTCRVTEHKVDVVVEGVPYVAEVTLTAIHCDHEGCGARFVQPGHDEGAVNDAARAVGWTWDEGVLDGCPLHPVRVR